MDVQRQNVEAQKQWEELEAKEPGRYQLLDANDLDNWQKQWKEENQNKGILGDTGLLLLGGVDALNDSIEGAANMIPGHKALSDWWNRFFNGKTHDEIMRDNEEWRDARYSDAMQTARQKNWIDVDEKTGEWNVGDAVSDWRSWYAGVMESLPSTVASMTPAGWVGKVIAGKEDEGANFRDWFDFHEPVRTLPSHRVLALLRGRQQGVLELRLGLDAESESAVNAGLGASTPHPCVAQIADFLELGRDLFAIDAAPRARWLSEVCRWTWRVKLLPAFESETFTALRDAAEAEAIRVFAANVKDLLLAAPAGPRAVLGLDPGIRTGVKVAAIDRTGKVLDTATIYPFEPRRDRAGSLATLAALVTRHQIELVAIGNGTASRETEKLVAELCKQPNINITRVVVSEAGASVYSASELAAREFPDLDVSLRGAVSIARRLQDPLAELVKIDPKAIGVGQYQHDVNQRELARALDAVVEDCVNAVGVDVNTASPALLTRVSGLSSLLAKNIVAHRDAHGPFASRARLLDVARFGDKAFEQAAGFLRIAGGENPLDASAVHPEAYPVVERILARIQAGAQSVAADIKAGINAVIGNRAALKGVSPADFTDEKFGLPTVRDIFAELEKPGRDPRPEFKAAQFQEGVETLKDLVPGMILEGVVTNVANFGAFVDVGVHQDGLVHVSALADKFVKDPRDVVRVGQTVKVKVQEVDVARQRIALTMRVNDDALPARRAVTGGRSDAPRRRAAPEPAAGGAMAQAFARLKR